VTGKARIGFLVVATIGAIHAPARSIVAATLTTVLVTDGVSQPVLVTAPTGDRERLFIVELGGRIRVILNGEVLPSPFLDIADIVLTGSEEGLLGLAFHPNYADNGLFFVNYTDLDGNTVVASYSCTADPNRADPASATTILTIDQPFFNHNGGCLAFGPLDGYLYIGTGDGGGAGDPLGNAQDRRSRLGKLLRIDVDAAAPFGVPPTNPFGPTTDPQDATLDEIWALGLRNPWRFSFDRLTGDLYIGDVGQSSREEIDFQPGGDPGGENYGWNIMEGTARFSPWADCDAFGLTGPVLDYGHAGAQCSVTGGYSYRGTAIDGLQGTYFFADFCSARIWSFRLVGDEVTELTERTAELHPSGGPTIGLISSFGEDADGELYICDLGGAVFKIVPRPATDSPVEPPDGDAAATGIEFCNDNLDNDGDGEVDAADTDCPGNDSCAFALCGICILPATLGVFVGLWGMKGRRGASRCISRRGRRGY
jgi:glucose/arabinose dehydrogenase